VKAYSAGTGFDIDTVIEYGGQLFKNVEYLVDVGGFTFRNPPNFMPKNGSEESLSRAAMDEIESVLDHLFHHPNTAVFIGYRLIQRLVTSNPSAGYVQAVGAAFRAGAYDGRTYSGRYGDLGATVAAVLLHPEARQGNSGLLREPLLKIVHFMRSLEFHDMPGRMIMMKDLSKLMGQFPYQNPSVFNFYLPDYAPDAFPDGLVSPEFQIFDTPFVVSFTEAMLAMIKSQGLSDCAGGYGIPSWSCRAAFPLGAAMAHSSCSKIWALWRSSGQRWTCS